MKYQAVARSLGQSHLMNPHPYVAQNEPQGDKEQSQVRVAGTGVDSSLPPLTITGFDAKPFAVTLADFGGIAMHSPGGEEQFLTPLFAVLAVPVTAVSDAHQDRDLPFAAFHRMRIPARRLSLDPAQAGHFASLFGRRPASFTGITNGKFSCCKNSITATLKNRPVQQEILDFQADFADLGQQATQYR